MAKSVKNEKTEKKPRKKKEAAEVVQEDAGLMQEAAEEVQDLDICYVYKDGDNLENVAKILTGNNYMLFKVCDYSGVNPCDVKPGTVLKWRF